MLKKARITAQHTKRLIAGFFLVGLMPTAPVKAALTDAIPFLEGKFPYELVIENNEDFADDLSDKLDTQRKESQEFDLFTQPRKAMRFDRDVLQKLLKAEGYFAANIASTLGDEDEIKHTIRLGPAYIVDTIELNFPDNAPPPELKTLPLQTGQALRATDVLQSVKTLSGYVKDNFCLYEVKVSYDARVNHELAKALVTFTLQPSPSVNFAEAELSGNTRIDTSFLMHFVTFEPGDCFKRDDIEHTRLSLLQSNLISRAEVTVGPPTDGKVSVSYALSEREHRTLKLGIGYESDTGMAFTPGWEHRNLFDRGEKLDVNALLSDKKNAITGELVFPHKWRENQTLTLTSEFAVEELESYEERSGEFGAFLKRPLSRRWTGTVGANLEFIRTIDPDGEDGADEMLDLDESDIDRERDYALLSFPVKLDYLRQNNLLNPTSGWALGTSVEPFVDLYQTGTRFWRTTIAASWYITADDWFATPTLATRASVGSISDIQLTDVPRSHRFYVGGGGSVRGYGYQLAGELDENGDPVGGLSYGETAVELRFRFSESWGAVIFADGGRAYRGERPQFGEDFLWGAGIGLRYFTSFAPIRFDIATPLDPRDVPVLTANDMGELEPVTTRIDDSIQIYISLGQAF